MIQMASVFGEQERQIIRSRVNAGLDRGPAQGKKLKVSSRTEDAIRRHLSAGSGILKVTALVGVGSGTVQRVRGSGWAIGGSINVATAPAVPQPF
jgi:DNA invertase Pin-like site-specific DNA recombinase